MCSYEGADPGVAFAGVARAEIARKLGVSPSTITRYARLLRFSDARRRPSPTDWTKVQRYYDAGHSIDECRERFGFSYGAWDKAVVRGDLVPRSRRNGELRRSTRDGIERFGFSRETFCNAVRRGDIVPRPYKIPIEELLVIGRPATGRTHLKARLLAESRKQNQCERCGPTEWLGRSLAMEIHHENGDPTDNRLPNLEFLCPNCHAQTDTWGGRNGHRRKPPAA